MEVTTLTVRNVNYALTEMLWKMRVIGLSENSRNGRVLVAPGPVVTTFTHPRERILFEPRRDANPVFHLMEALWMLAGQNDVKWLQQFNSNISNYAQPDGKMHGAYGYRWRHQAGFDQLLEIVKVLQNSETRQAVLAMWIPLLDLCVDPTLRDRPCNTHVYFDRRGGRLNMTVSCRSNDMLWGAYGANVVHFSILQEVLAWALKVPVGVFHQFANNFHLYTELPMVADLLDMPPEIDDSYYMSFPPTDLLTGNEHWEDFLLDCQDLVSGHNLMTTYFMQSVAKPLRDHYLARKRGEFTGTSHIFPTEWKVAYKQWIDRRDAK